MTSQLDNQWHHRLRDTSLVRHQRQIPALEDRLVVSKLRLWVTGGICARRRMTRKPVRAAVSARAGLSGNSASLDLTVLLISFLFMFNTRGFNISFCHGYGYGYGSGMVRMDTGYMAVLSLIVMLTRLRSIYG